MVLDISYDNEFTSLMERFRERYPKRIFDIEGIGKQLDINSFSQGFFNTVTTTADISVDGNANVSGLTVTSYLHEAFKPIYKLNSFYMLWKEARKKFGPEVAANILESEISGMIYINDFHGLGAGIPYCYNYSTYDIAIKGLSMVDKIKCIPPKHFLAFKSQLEQFVTVAANCTLGATGLADLLIVSAHYVKNILDTGSDAHFEMINLDLAFTFDENQTKLFRDGQKNLEIELGKLLSNEQISLILKNGFLSPDVFETFTEEQWSFYRKGRKELLTSLIDTFTDKQKGMYSLNVYQYVRQQLISFVYTINQPMRVIQSPFTNISIYDDLFLKDICPNYIFLDGSEPDINIVKKLQVMFLDIMNTEMDRTPITFPIVSGCMSIDENKKIRDKEFVEMIARKNLKYGFINFYSGKTGTLSSCCRLRSDMIDDDYFNSFGSGSMKIGSQGVVTLSLPAYAAFCDGSKEKLLDMVEYYTWMAAQINHIKREIISRRIANGNHPLYAQGFMSLDTQYSTAGVNGLYECISMMGLDMLDPEGQELSLDIMAAINKINDKAKEVFKARHNCEQIPGESASVKLAEKHSILGLQDKYRIYSNQFIPLTTKADMLDRIKLQGLFDKHFSGGAIAHINVEERITDPQLVANLIHTCAEMGIVYWAMNYMIQECESGHMTVGRGTTCNQCHARIIDEYTRVVGFLTSTKSWNKTRREVDAPNRQWYSSLSTPES